MKLKTTNNLDEVFHDLDAFASSSQGVAIPRALNRLSDLAQVAGLRKVAELYGIGPRASERYLRNTLATKSNPQATISATGRRFPLSLMQPRQTKAGVSVLIKGRRVLIPHAFMNRSLAGGTHVFARGSYGGKASGLRRRGDTFGRFVFGKGRTPIGELYTFGPAETMSNPDVVAAMEDRIVEQLDSVLAREIGAAKRGF